MTTSPASGFAFAARSAGVRPAKAPPELLPIGLTGKKARTKTI